MREKALAVTEQVDRAILGKRAEVREVFLALLANGHVLLEDVPGTGKTTLALAFSKALALDFRRVQFTPDVLPSDLTGFSVYHRSEEAFLYEPGSVFCNLLLADELNRTPPKTQSALLEVMEERRVTAEGVTRSVPDPFLVIATQNPAGGAGTFPLPETQLDRFMVSLSLGFPDYDSELEMAKSVGAGGRADAVEPVASREEFLAMQREIHGVFIHDDVYRYLLDLVRATREHPLLRRGASPRAVAALVKLSKAAAWLSGRDFVTPADAAAQFPCAVSHRVARSAEAKLEGTAKAEILGEILKAVKKPAPGKK